MSLFDMSDLLLNQTMDIFEFSKSITLVEGPKKGFQFDPSKSVMARIIWPYLFGDKKEQFNEFIITGPSQSGKSLVSFIIPSIYIAYYMRENSILSSPTLTLIQKKYTQSVLETIILNRHLARDLLHPKYWDGSYRNPPKMSYNNPLFRYHNGTMVSFMSTQSGDKGKSAETARNIFITEFGGARRVTTSEEADAIEQIRARARSYISVGYRMVLESTQTTNEGVVYDRYHDGCQGVVSCDCPSCGERIEPKRTMLVVNKENLKGSYLECPKCKFQITEEHRRKLLESAYLHMHGSSKSIFSFSMSGFFNHFYSLENLAIEELGFINSTPQKKDSKDRELQNFVWGEPYTLPNVHELTLDLFSEESKKKIIDTTLYKSQLPDNTKYITCGIDSHVSQHYYTIVAWTQVEKEIKGHIIEYGRFKTKFDSEKFLKSQDQIISEALLELHEILKTRYKNKINIYLADIGQMQRELLSRIGRYEKSHRLIGAVGFKRRASVYTQTTGTKTLMVCEDLSYRENKAVHYKYVEHDSSQERKYVQDYIRRGDVKLYQPQNDPEEHEQFLKSIFSHVQTISDAEGFKWKKIENTSDHHLDATILSFSGLKLLNRQVSFADPSQSFSGDTQKKKYKNVIDINPQPVTSQKQGMKIINRQIKQRR